MNRHRFFRFLFLFILLSFFFFLVTQLDRLTWFWASRDFVGWDISATSQDDIYVVGSHILHYDGKCWYRMDYDAVDRVFSENEEESHSFLGLFELPTAWGWAPPDFYDVEAYDAKHIYAGGAAGILQCDGERWSAMPVLDELELYPYDIWVQNPDSIYAVDGTHGLFSWDGQSWRLESQDVTFNRRTIETLHVGLLGGNDESVVAIGDGLTLLLNSGDGWQQVDIAPLLENIELHERANDSYGLQLNGVWGLDDGRILVGVWENVFLTPRVLYNCKCLLCYQDGTWTVIPTPDYWHPWEILIDSHGNLASLNEYGERYQYVTNENEANPIWQHIDEEMNRYWGPFIFLDNSSLLVYGGELYTYASCSDCPAMVSIPCRVESYELTW